MGKDGSTWKHGYDPTNAAAVALKMHRKPGKGASASKPSRKPSKPLSKPEPEKTARHVFRSGESFPLMDTLRHDEGMSPARAAATIRQANRTGSAGVGPGFALRHHGGDTYSMGLALGTKQAEVKARKAAAKKSAAKKATTSKAPKKK
jgi:hypothetical protein